MRRATAERLATLGYGVSTALLVIVGLVLYMANERGRESGRLVDRTLEVLESIARINAGVALAESAQRGNFLYDEERFLWERDAAFGRLRSELENLQRLTSENPSEQSRVSELGRLVEKRIERMHQNLLARRLAIERSAPLPVPGAGQELSATIYALSGGMRNAQLRVLESQRQTEAGGFRIVNWILAASTLVLGAVILPAYARFVRAARGQRQAETRLRDLIESLPGAVFQWRIWPDGSKKYELLSSSSRDVRGVHPEAALRDAGVIADTVLEADRQMYEATVAHGITAMKPVQMDYRIRRSNNEVRWIRSVSAPSPRGDGSVLWSGHWEDITTRKELEAGLLRAMEGADTANRAKSRFLATMSHEIRTPMNGVLGMLELMSLSRLDDPQKATLRVVRESGRSLLRIIDDILDFSKIEAGMMDLRLEAGSLANTIERVCNMHAGAASSKAVLLKSFVDPRISRALLFDPVRLQQVLNNLVNNAIKFTSRGSVSIETRLVEKSGGREIVRFEVRDTGIGMTGEEQERLFEPFTQATVEVANRYGGTGLGLSICRRLAELMGGTIELTSEAGIGTRVAFVLPLEVADEAAAAPESTLEASPASTRTAPSVSQAEQERMLVLVVDDHPINRMVMLTQMNTLGYAAESADNGREALEKWITGRFAAILTDCNMPELSGFELAREVRASEARGALPRTPIIACTANALAGEAEKCLAAGMDDYLAKPVQLSQLAAKLQRWLPSPPEAPPLEAATLAEISLGDEAFARDVLARFQSFNLRDAAMLREAFARSDGAGLVSGCHRIKGAARTIGAIALAAACEDMDTSARSEDWSGAADAMKLFEHELARLDAYIDSRTSRQHG